jgi:hypothetical protein
MRTSLRVPSGISHSPSARTGPATRALRRARASLYVIEDLQRAEDKGSGERFFRNTSHRTHENLDVEPLDEEQLHVAQYLCAVASAYLILGANAKAACQIEQASDLLEERARVVAARERFKRLELQ